MFAAERAFEIVFFNIYFSLLSNVIIFETVDGVVLKYSDFYLAKENFEKNLNITNIPGISEYTAPEVIFVRKYTNSVDVWWVDLVRLSFIYHNLTGFSPHQRTYRSLGCIIYEMITLNKAIDLFKLSHLQRDESCIPVLPDDNKYKFLVQM